MGEGKKTIKVEKIQPHPDNAKTHPPEQLDRIAEVIKGLGWGRPILISKDNYILAGHGAVEAATTRLGYTEFPYRQVEYNHDTPEAIALMDADNKLGELSDWDYNKLELHFEDLKIQGFNLELTGFTEDEIKIPDFQPVSEDEQPRLDKLEPKGLKCPECGHEW